MSVCINYVLLKALPPVCTKYTAQDKSQVANIAAGKVKCYNICHKTLIKRHEAECFFLYSTWDALAAIKSFLTILAKKFDLINFF